MTPQARPRLAIVASHPIQYYAPFYRALDADGTIDVHVLFCARIGLDRMLDPEMGVELAWKTDLLSGYAHTFLSEAGAIRATGFRSVDNPSLAGELARVRPDVVLLHGYASRSMLRALAWCRRRRIPAMMISDSSLHSGTPPLARLAKALALPPLLRQFRAFLSIGDANQAYLEHFGVPRRSIFRVPNTVDEQFWRVRTQRESVRAQWRERLALAGQDLALLFVGKLIPRKRPADLLRALDKLGHEGAAGRIRLLIAGDGELRGELEAAAATRNLPVTFLGFINLDELPGIYCAADALVHPAEIETFGMIALEAAVIGLPLLLSDRVGAIGPSSIARPGVNALVYPCGDTSALAAAMLRVAADPGLAARMGDASLRISAELDRRASVAGTLAAIDYCLSGQRSSDRASFAGAATTLGDPA